MVDTYVKDLEERIEYLETVSDRYKGFISKLDIVNPHLNLSDIEQFLTVEAILGYCQDNLQVSEVKKSAREVKVMYIIKNQNDGRTMNISEVIHYTKESNKNSQIASCVLILRCLWDNNINKKINLAVDIMDSEKYYDPFKYGRI